MVDIEPSGVRSRVLPTQKMLFIVVAPYFVSEAVLKSLLWLNYQRMKVNFLSSGTVELLFVHLTPERLAVEQLIIIQM